MKEEIKSILKEVLYNSLAQAILKIIQTPHVILKVFLLTFSICSSGLTSYLVIKSIMAYFSYSVTTTSRIINETPTLFPKVTFCNINSFTTKFAFDLSKKNITNGNSLSNEEKKKLSHDFNNILIECTFNQKKCDSSVFSWSYDPLYGNCYTFNSGFNSNETKIDLSASTISDPTYGLQLTLYINVYEELLTSLKYGLGALIRIGNSSYLTDYGSGGVFIIPGLNTYLSVRREINSILPMPYSNCEVDKTFNSDLYNLIITSNYAYSQQTCFTQCTQKYFISKYNCSLPFILSLYKVSECSLNVFLKFDLFFDEKFIQKLCLPLCPLECNRNLFSNSISFSQLSGSQYASLLKASPNLVGDFINRSIDSMTARESVARVNVFYESLSYTSTTESPQMDLVALLASIGGNLGLFLGVSVFSLCELIQVVIEIYFAMKKT
jgi:hypothetical protein